MHLDAEKTLLKYISDYRDPFVFFFAGFLIGIGWYIFGVLLIFIIIYALTKNVLIKVMLKSSSKIITLFIVNIIIGVCMGIWQQILVDEFLGLTVLFFITLAYFNIKLYRKILLDYIQLNI